METKKYRAVQIGSEEMLKLIKNGGEFYDFIGQGVVNSVEGLIEENEYPSYSRNKKWVY